MFKKIFGMAKVSGSDLLFRVRAIGILGWTALIAVFAAGYLLGMTYLHESVGTEAYRAGNAIYHGGKVSIAVALVLAAVGMVLYAGYYHRRAPRSWLTRGAIALVAIAGILLVPTQWLKPSPSADAASIASTSWTWSWWSSTPAQLPVVNPDLTLNPAAIDSVTLSAFRGGGEAGWGSYVSFQNRQVPSDRAASMTEWASLTDWAAKNLSVSVSPAEVQNRRRELLMAFGCTLGANDSVVAANPMAMAAAEFIKQSFASK